MDLLKFVKNPHFRIKSTHIIAIVLLLLNAVLFTHDTFSIVIQLAIAFTILLHHLDDEKIKKDLFKIESVLREDTNIFDNNVIVSETDLDGIITYVNKNYINITGYTKEELIGSKHSKIKSNETSDATYQRLWQTLNENKTYTGVFKNKKKDDSPFWINTHISPIITNSVKTGYKAIMFDITDKILTQETLKNTIENKDLILQEQATRFEFAINSSRDGFWDYDLVNSIFYLSDGWKKRLGFKDEGEFKYLDYLSLIPDEHRFEHHSAMHDLIDHFPDKLKYVHFRIKYPLVTKDGEKLVIEDVGDIFFDEKQAPIRITGFHRDITDQERQSKIIESQNRVSAMGEMISNIAHQWRQPIGAINNVLNDLELDIELDDLEKIDTKAVLNTSAKVKEYTAYLSRTIDDFRKLTSADKQKVDFLVENTIKKAYEISKVEYEKNKINFQIIESSDALCELNGYERELQQVIINILNNAKDILIENEIENPSVKVSIITEDNYIKIVIHDNAGGIPDSIMPKIFDPYFTTKHESVGTGIGLYMSKKIIVEYFNGSLEVENENSGAKFTIEIPRDL